MAATDPTPFNADAFVTVNAAAPNRLTAVTYIGAVQDAADTWYHGLDLQFSPTRISGASSGLHPVPA